MVPWCQGKDPSRRGRPMTLHRRLIPITALVVAIGASAAGAATAAATNGKGGGPATPKPPAPIVKCGVDVVDKGKEKGKSPDGKKDGSDVARSEERREGKEGRSRWSPYH